MPSPPTTATLTMLDGLFMPISSQNGSRAARRGRPPERRGFRCRAATSARLHRDLQASPARRRGSISKRCRFPVGEVIVCSSRSTPMRPAPCVGSISAARPSTISLSTTIGKDAVLKAVGEENIAEARADDGADAHLLQRPHRAFTGGAAAEIGTGDEDFRLPIRLAVQNEFGVLRTIRQIAQRTERPFAERAANGISDQTLDADDDIGIDVAAHDRRGNRRQLS